MDIKQIQDLIRFVSKSGVNEVSIEQENFKITIKTNEAPTYVNASLPVPQPLAAAAAPQPSLPAAPAVEAAPVADTSNLITVRSPMIGTFYRSSSPDKPLFVNVGDEIGTGSILCIIEAMKLFNEIESEVSGRIVKILVDNASPVEYDQPLFLVEPK
ncbi:MULTISPECIES: acetyl-CoA carboxylase biotin carboxyl carrier protein [unclassified Mucilaginibacter]|uniref:acetyl-CoA carboxylase biotin carboxyl carrier protein n=1 Tax=unclassified Mucilaginibacter TaxID=2617802 RepID=UPI002AC91612|nr:MULTISPECIES: acetyl-CoA carboxylase biotin carboxyl carrier protein [unclassified Mucilaginibacter]MEB0262013.1 acetyl-CoA carboxylase biotin carboxyl carrier protein [Mucilaginibacter sp. 10I4]MEB0279723.1 acetyl-CoA carboxylase biotin carboxyl carrier protein [Mucilaginibacter sp. 10B2]MEB0301684.1 acetyl-CoA carboxylase biotin carboxyl carrier protein [Mucilaginibacter sp. 5C4]WPX23718.1 acetyl-CoA carboxylase biotin carboxyl carrier protein [Mucilaginibacter sp. 5C4]